jgi:hypothetical protein
LEQFGDLRGQSIERAPGVSHLQRHVAPFLPSQVLQTSYQRSESALALRLMLCVGLEHAYFLI